MSVSTGRTDYQEEITTIEILEDIGDGQQIRLFLVTHAEVPEVIAAAEAALARLEGDNGTL